MTARIDVVGSADDDSNTESEPTLADLVPGAYAVTATATGYAVAQSVVSVREGEAAALTITLEPFFPTEATPYAELPPSRPTVN